MDLIDQPIFLEGISAKHFLKAKLVGYSSHPVLLINRGAGLEDVTIMVTSYRSSSEPLTQSTG